MNDWKIFREDPQPHDDIALLPEPPPWRNFKLAGNRAETYKPTGDEIDMVNAALYLRRPLLVTGKPGTGKSSLAYAVARQLKLGDVLVWPISTKTTFNDGLYGYDAIGRLQAKGTESESLSIEKFIRLGALGTALATSKARKPRVLLIDEIDKSDVDLPNDLLNVLEQGTFEIRELRRLGENAKKAHVLDADGVTQEINYGVVRADEFPFVIMTSNGEREFPPAFLRRCLRLDLPEPSPTMLASIANAHLAKVEGEGKKVSQDALETEIKEFVKARASGDLATDQLLNSVFILARGLTGGDETTREEMRKKLLHKLS